MLESPALKPKPSNKNRGNQKMITLLGTANREGKKKKKKPEKNIQKNRTMIRVNIQKMKNCT